MLITLVPAAVVRTSIILLVQKAKVRNLAMSELNPTAVDDMVGVSSASAAASKRTRSV